jgi:glycosyltransferase involved in cell wall biosynthesis
VVDIVRHADGVDHEVVVPPADRVAGRSGAPMDTAALDRIIEAGAVLHVMDMRRTPLHAANAAAVIGLRQLIERRQPDVVHGHSSVGGALSRAAVRGDGTVRVYTPHGLARGRLALSIERQLGRRTDHLIAVSASEGHQVVDLGVVPPDRVTVIPNGVDLAPAAVPTIDLRAHFGLPPATPLVGSVARLVPQKAPEQFVRACCRVAARRPDVHFVYVGRGPLQDRLDHEIAEGRLGDRFHQLDYLADAWAVFDQLDCFVLLSAFEGGPYTPLEAMRAGAPVVVSDVVGNRDAVEDGVTGLLAPFGAAEGAAGAILRLLNDHQLRATVVDQATARLQARFDARLMGGRLSQLYADWVASAKRRRTRRLPQPASATSTNAPDDRAAQ